MIRAQPIPYQQVRAGTESQISLPPHIGRGYVRFLGCSSGMQLMLSDFTLNAPTRFEHEDFPPIFGFGFFLSGDFLIDINGVKHADTIRAGQSGAYHYDGRIKDTYGVRRAIRLILMAEPQTFQNFLAGDREDAFLSLRQLAPSRFLLNDLTPAMRCVLLQLMACPYQGLTRDFFLQSKVLELISYKLDQLESERSRTPIRTGLKAGEMDRIRYAGELMARNLAAPPGVAELAGQVGMCQSRLHRCFKEVFGMTPFDYLRRERLEAARRLLDQGGKNVTEIAYAVGYSSLSHFSKAFRRYTGCLPGQYRRRRSAK